MYFDPKIFFMHEQQLGYLYKTISYRGAFLDQSSSRRAANTIAPHATWMCWSIGGIGILDMTILDMLVCLYIHLESQTKVVKAKNSKANFDHRYNHFQSLRMETQKYFECLQGWYLDYFRGLHETNLLEVKQMSKVAMLGILLQDVC